MLHRCFLVAFDQKQFEQKQFQLLKDMRCSVATGAQEGLSFPTCKGMVLLFHHQQEE